MKEQSTTINSLQRTGKTEICVNCGAIRREIKFPTFSNQFIKIMPMCKCQKEIDEREKTEEEQREKKKRIERLFKQSRLGERFKECTFDSFKLSEETLGIQEKIKKYAETFINKKESLFLHSHPGTGKTFLTAALTNHLINKGKSVVFVVVPDLLSKIKGTYSNKSTETAEDLIKGLAECDLLIFDDLGAERHTSNDDWANEMLFQIINNRYINNKPIVFTSNLNLKEMNEKLSPRTFSRICEMTNRTFEDMNNIKDVRIHGI